MAVVNKSTLKAYFEQGDIPTQAQYVDLIESQFNLAETGTQAISSSLVIPAANIDYLNLKKAYLPGVGVGSAKVGTSFAVGRTLEVVGSAVVSGTGSFGHLSITQGSISSSGEVITNNITASGNISASGTGSFGYISSSADLSIRQISASGTISSSATITAQNIILGYGGYIYAKDSSGNTNDSIVYNGADALINFGDSNSATYVAGTNIKLDAPITASGIISASITSGVHRFGTTISSSGGFTGSHVWGTDYVSSSGHIGAPRITASLGGVMAIGQIFTTTNVTASGAISASGVITGGTLYIDGDISSSNSLLVSKSLYMGSGSENLVMGAFNTTLDSFVFGNQTVDHYYQTKDKHQFLGGNVVIGVTNNFTTSTLDVDGNISTDSHITASGNISSSGEIIATGNLSINGDQIDFRNLLQSDPGVAGRLWRSGRDLKISIG